MSSINNITESTGSSHLALGNSQLSLRSWEHYPLLQPAKDKPDPHFQNLREAIISIDNYDNLLERCQEFSFAQKLVRILLRSDTTCSDLARDSVKQYNYEHTFFTRESLSEDEQQMLAAEDLKARKVLEKIIDMGFNPEWIKKTQDIVRQAQLPSHDVESAYNVIRGLHLYSQSNRSTNSLIRSHADSTFSDESIARFSLDPTLCFTERGTCPGRIHSWTFKTFNEPRSATGLKSFWIWMDAPFGMLLLKDGQPQAICSFSINSKENALCVHQIQGVFGVECLEDGNGASEKLFSPSLFGVSFRDMFFSLAEELTIACELKKIIILGAKNNLWIKPNRWKKVPTYTKKDAIKHYDLTAKNRGYALRSDQNWELGLM